MANVGTHIIKIDETFCDLWNNHNHTVEQIAGLYGCSIETVRQASRRAGLPKRPQRRRPFVKTPIVAKEPEKPAPPPEPRAALAHPDFPLERDAALMATGGKYAEIEKLAKRWGLPVSRVAARWHLVRV